MRAKSLAYLTSTKLDRSAAELPPGSRPGSSSDGAAPPPKERTAYDIELDCVEELLDEMCLIKAQWAKDLLEAGEPALDVADYFYRCTSIMAHRYRDFVPRVRVSFKECQKLRQGVTVMIEGFNFDTSEELFLDRFARFKRGGMTSATTASSGSNSTTRRI